MNFLKRCWQKRWLRRLAWAFGALVALCFLTCTWVNWSGARQWRATQAMLKAEGETLDFRATMNEPIPESENFCAIPLLKDLALVVDNDANKGEPGENRKRLKATTLPSNSKAGMRPKLTNAILGKRTDLKVWADWLRKEGSLPMPADSGDAARDVLAALSKHDAIVQELAAGLNRPKAQWTPEWKTREFPEMIFAVALPHHSSIMGVCQALALRATGAARAGDAAKAHETALIIARLSQASLNDPFLIGLLVAMAETSTLCGAIWELCDAHAGTADDFTKVEAALTGLDFHQGTLRAGRSEMAAGLHVLELIKRKREHGLALFAGMDNWELNGSAWGDFAFRSIPSGFFDSNAAVLADREFKYLLKPLRDQGWNEARQALQDWEKELAEMRGKAWTHPSYIMIALIAPVFTSAISKANYTEVLVNQAVIACALERHRIENGSYPDSLDSIKLADGKSLPLDVVNGKPMNYRKTTDGRYVLWSVGFDGKDDGGKRVLDKEKPERTRFDNEKYVGDWVWDFPAE